MSKCALRIFAVACCLMGLALAVEARSLRVQQQALAGGEQTPIVSVVSAANSPSATSQPVGGIKEFVVALHDRTMYEKAEAETMFTVMEKQWNTTGKEVLGELVDVRKRLEVANQTIAEQWHEDAVIKGIVERLREEQRPIQERLNETWKIFNVTQINWKLKVDDLARQRDTALGALQSVEDIVSRLGGPTPDTNIMGKLIDLRKLQQMTKKGSTVSSMLNTAIAAASVPNTGATSDMLDSVLGTLRKNLLSHAESLWENLVMANNSWSEHNAKMMIHINGLTAEIGAIDDKIAIEEKPLKDIHAYIAELEEKRRPDLVREYELQTQFEKLNFRMNYELEAFRRQSANREARLKVIEAMHQFIKARLIDGNAATKALLASVVNPLRLKGNFALEWESMLNKNSTLSSIDPNDLKSELCGSWKFNEGVDDPYSVDSSKYGNDGKLHGISIRRFTGAFDGNSSAVTFDGINDYIDLGGVGGFGSHLNNFTVEFWVKTTDSHPAAASIVKVVEQGHGMVIAIDMNRRVGVRHNDGTYPVGQQPFARLDSESGSTLVYLRDTRGRVLAGHVRADYFDGRWHHIQWSVRDSSQNDMHFWMDGKPYPFIATVEQGPMYFRNLTTNLFLGAGDIRGTASSFFDGALSTVQLWCQATYAPPQRVCCKVCPATTVACGDQCVAADAQCVQRPGCACNALEPGVPEKPNI